MVNVRVVATFASVIVFAALVWPTDVAGKIRLEGAKVMLSPVALIVATCGLPGAVSATVTVAPRAPVAVGVKVTLIVHWLAAPSCPPTGQLLVCEKSPALVPPKVMLLTLNAWSPISRRGKLKTWL